MQSTMSPLNVSLPATPFVFDPDSLYARLRTLTDGRDPRGVRYPLAALLTIATLAKLAGQNQTRDIAEWAQLRAPILADCFALHRLTMPHHTTWSRVFADAVDPTAFAHLVADFLIAAIPPVRGARKRRRGTIALCLDGKTLRGTIPAGKTRGVHLLAAYLPGDGVTLIEVAVAGKENEIITATQVVAAIDVRGTVVTGDAMFAQRALSRQVRQRGGDYLWCVKENQEELYHDIATLFTTPPVPATPDDFTQATSCDTEHGRYEVRRLTASRLLTGYLDWPHAQQVFRIERYTLLSNGTRRQVVSYGVTSLPPMLADAARLLALARGHWGVENGLFYRRDVTLGEDRGLLRRGNGPQVMATLNDLTLGLVARQGQRNVAQARRIYAAFPNHALALLTSA